MVRLGMAGAFASAVLFCAPARAQDESRLSLAERVSRLEQVQSQQQGGTSLVNQMQQMQSQMQQMEGQIEELQHQLQELQDKGKAQYQDLDSRIGHIEGAGASTTASQSAPASASASSTAAAAVSELATPSSAPASSAPAAVQAPVAGNSSVSVDEQVAYNAAFKSLRGGDYVTASKGFRTFIEQHPQSPLAPNAWYWLGKSYYAVMNYPVALQAFQRLLASYPQSDKAPDALLEMGYTQIEMKQTDAGKATLKLVVANYPSSKAAALAQDRLRWLQAAVGN